MQCPQGRKLKQTCALRWITAMMVIEDCPFLRCVYWCVGICSNHTKNNECRIFDYTHPDQKAKLGKGDEILNLPEFIRCIPWPKCANESLSLSQFTSRYKFSVDFMMEFLKIIIVQGLSYFI